MNKNVNKSTSDQPFNDLPLLPPEKEKTETKKVLRQTITSSIALAELKGLVHTLPNPAILLNAVILREAKASSEIENVITTHDKLYHLYLQKVFTQTHLQRKSCAIEKQCWPGFN
ncbi:MAG: Fic/DOC family N-terminal domain-containing protein [Ginsengibacter sp.]